MISNWPTVIFQHHEYREPGSLQSFSCLEAAYFVTREKYKAETYFSECTLTCLIYNNHKLAPHLSDFSFFNFPELSFASGYLSTIFDYSLLNTSFAFERGPPLI
jgi:hypothetical protein